MRKDIAVVIVLYNPSEKQVEHVRQMSAVCVGVVVDNSPQRLTDSHQIGSMQYIFNNGNKGIATAQNIAISKILECEEVRYIVFLDQDSAVGTSYPADIVAEYVAVKADFGNLAILGPYTYYNDKDKEYGSKIHKDRFLTGHLIVRDKIISSGSCIQVDTLREIGLFDGRLFIDYVDSEWCWRANSRGMICAITTNLKMNHRIGIKTISMGPMRDNVSAPQRYFYQYRNYIWMLRRGYVPLKWKINNGLKSIVRLIYYPLFVERGRECASFMLKGIVNGIKTFNQK